jgi:hypothetical protein
VAADVPAPEGPFDTAFRVQNLGSAAATCQLVFYDTGGSEAYSSALPSIPVDQSTYVYVPDLATLADGQYAGVVSCDQEVAAVVNISDPDSGASYSGVSEPAGTLYAPGIYDNYFNYYSDVVVQNASSASNDITLEIFEPGNTTPVYADTKTAPVNGFVAWEQEGLPQLANNQFYSAKISGTGDVAAIVNIYGRGPFDDQLYSYNPFASGSLTAYAPVIMDQFFGYNTALVIQNMGSSDASVTITYSDGTVKSSTIAPGAADSRYTPGEGLTSPFVGAKVESDQEIVLLVNESTDMNRAASYTGFAEGSTSVQAPIVMRRYFNYNTSVTCQNIGTSATTMSISYGGISGSTTSPSIAVNATALFYQPGDPLLSDGFIGSATITASEDIVCVVNEDMNEEPQASQIMDQLYAYNGIGN